MHVHIMLTYVRTLHCVSLMMYLSITDLVNIYHDKLNGDNVVDAFTYLFGTLGKLFAKIDFVEFKRVCMLRGAPLPQDFKQKIKAAQELDDILDVLDDPLYCNWLNVRLLKTIAKNINDQQAEKLIQIYENSVYSRKVSDVKQYFSICFDKKTVSRIELKINKIHDADMTIKDVFNCCKGLEKILDIYTGAVSVTGSSPGCLKITVVIPIHCSLLAFSMAKKNYFKLRQLHIQYLEIETFSKVFALNFPDKENVDAVLSTSTFKKCKFTCSSYVCMHIASHYISKKFEFDYFYKFTKSNNHIIKENN